MTLWKQGRPLFPFWLRIHLWIPVARMDRAGLLSGDMTRGERFGLLGAPAARAGRSRAREP